jgi:hypothetical protein
MFGGMSEAEAAASIDLFTARSCRTSSSSLPADPRRVIDIDGAYDLHVHSAPDLFPRIADDRQMVADAAAKASRAWS